MQTVSQTLHHLFNFAAAVFFQAFGALLVFFDVFLEIWALRGQFLLRCREPLAQGLQANPLLTNLFAQSFGRRVVRFLFVEKFVKRMKPRLPEWKTAASTDLLVHVSRRLGRLRWRRSLASCRRFLPAIVAIHDLQFFDPDLFLEYGPQRQRRLNSVG